MDALAQHGKLFDLEVNDKLPAGAFMLVDKNAIVMETISKDELDEVDIKVEEFTNANDFTPVEKLIENSENFINFDFDFSNL